MSGLQATGWPAAVLTQPAAVSVPLSFAVMVVGSLLTRDRVPAHLARTMVRLHAPEHLDLDRGSYHPERQTG
jgi:Na+(H+)/acetate symporter ActP